MYAAIWKSAALAGVIGVGCGGVWYVQRDLASTTLEPNKFSELDPGIQGQPVEGLAAADPVEITSTTIPEVGSASPFDELEPLVGESQAQAATAPPPVQTEPNPGIASDSLDQDVLAVADAGAATPDAGAKWPRTPAPATRNAEPVAEVAETSQRNDKQTTDPWGEVPGLAMSPAPAQPSSSEGSDLIDLVAHADESRPVEGAADNRLQALPPGHPGPVLLSVPAKGSEAKTAADELFLPDIGGQSEPASETEIVQVQNELPEIRSSRTKSTIPTQNAPPVSNPFYQRESAGNAEQLPTITPAGGNLPRTAVVPGVERFAPAANEPTVAPQTPQPAPARSSNPFAIDSFAPPPTDQPTPAPAAFPAAFPAEEAKPAAVRSTIPGAGMNRTAEPATAPPASPAFQFEPISETPNPTRPAPEAVPAFPSNRNSIPELQSIPSFPTSNLVPDPNVAPNPNVVPTDTPPTRRDPIIDLIGDGTVSASAPSGPQQPEIKIEKIAPAEAVVGEALIYQIKVRNVGQSTAHRVIVEDRIPLGATCQGTIPQAETAEKRLFWKLGDMRPNEERDIKVKLTPTQAGSIGSVATVSFAAEVAATTVVTAPELKVELETPRQIILGEPSVFRIRVQNTGQGLAKAVFLRALLPKELKHPGGNDLEYEIGNLAPGQFKDVELNVAAEAQGVLTPKVIVSTNNQEQDSRTAQVSVIDTRLKVVRTGPAKRFVGRPAAYSNSVTNQSLDALRDVQVVETVPRDLEPTGKLSNGQWDPQNRTITWRIPQIAPGETLDLPIDLIPKKPGTFDGTLQVTDAGGNKANVATHVDVAGYSNLVVDVVPDGPVAVGEQVSMRLSVRNRGTAPASNVQTVFEVPAHLKFVNANGPVQHQAAGNVIHFAALDTLPPGGEQEFDIVLTAAQEGDARVKVDLYSDDHKTEPLHQEGEVRVYRDGGR